MLLAGKSCSSHFCWYAVPSWPCH